jgi:hypothetical protein
MLAGMTGKAATSTSAKATTLDLTVGWTTHTFTGTNGSAPPSPFVLKASSTGSSATIQSNQLDIATPNLPDFAGLHAVGFTPASNNYEFLFDFIINNTTGEQYQSFCWRVQNPAAVSGMYYVGLIQEIGGGKNIFAQEVDASYNFINKGGTSGLSWTIGDVYHFRVRVNGTTHQVRWWKNSDPEDGSIWNVTFSDSTYTSGDVMFLSQGGITGAARNHRYDNVSYNYL